MAAVSPVRLARVSEAGFTLVEMLVALGITTVILGATMAALADAVKATDAAGLVTGLNGSLRTGMDLMVRDLLQAGQGLPTGRVIQIPSGTGVAPIRLPGPPTTAYTYTGTSFCPPPVSPSTASLCTRITAIIPGPGRGPAVVAGQPTDMITMIGVDSAFDSVRLTGFAANSGTVTIEPGVNISDNLGADDLEAGDLLMLVKGSTSALAQVSSVALQVVTFTAGDSLLLNQTAAALDGTVGDLRATAPVDVVGPVAAGIMSTTVSRIRMISYYLDATTEPLHPRLVRRINNGDAVTFNNLLGTVVAFDIEDLDITYDMADGVTSGVRMIAADLQGGGACGAAACSPNLIRKVNVVLSGRSRIPMRGTRQFFRNRLSTQVSVRSLAFLDRYR
jgi:prepilin-type N-terminal cleavage/methylation domain-containing protein